MIVKPLENILENLRFRAKFVLVFLVVAVGMSLLATLLVIDRTAAISNLEQEQLGLSAWRPMIETIRFQQRSRGQSAIWNSGDDGASNRMLAAMAEADTQLAKVEAQSASLPATAAPLSAWKASWLAVRQEVSSKANPNLPKLHTAAINQGLEMLQILSAESGLLLDSATDSHYLHGILYEDIPLAIEYYGQFRALGSAINTARELTPDSRDRLLMIEMRLDTVLQRLYKQLDGLEKASGATIASLIRDYKNAVTERRARVTALIKALRQGEYSDAHAFHDEMSGVIDRAYAYSEDKLFPALDKALATRLEAARRDRLLVLGVVAAVFTILSLLFWAMTRNVVCQVANVQRVAKALAEGDLSQPLKATSKDELGVAIAALAEGMGKLRGIFGEFRSAIVKIEVQSETLACANSQVAAASAHQADTVAQIAATVEEMNAGISCLSSSAITANECADHSEALSVDGGLVVSCTVKEIASIANRVEDASVIIQRLGTESAKISTVVNVIKEIADQTNLLALNAAIEAARAGETGRGFAVVADEVRKLAERTTGATQEISTTIAFIQKDINNAVDAMASSVNNVSTGVASAENSGKAMEQIHANSTKVQHMVGEIAHSLKEQSIAAQEVTQNIETLAQISEENHAAAESAKEATQALRAQMFQLENRMKGFQV
ncbi:MAG: HAMP domain-containing methyl-accepting chemotaxis protein [Rhodocyclaceae bacterium]